MTDILYRALEVDDVPTVLDLVRRTVRTSYQVAYSPGAIEFFVRHHSEEDIAADVSDGAAIVAVLNGAIAGTAALRGAEMRRVFVEPALQGRGIGRSMVSALLRRAGDRGVTQVWLDSSTVSRRMYERMGFSVTAERSIDLGGGDSLPYYRMVKGL